jgi:hypothetical protein
LELLKSLAAAVEEDRHRLYSLHSIPFQIERNLLSTAAEAAPSKSFQQSCRPNKNDVERERKRKGRKHAIFQRCMSEEIFSYWRRMEIDRQTKKKKDFVALKRKQSNKKCDDFEGECEGSTT